MATPQESMEKILKKQQKDVESLRILVEGELNRQKSRRFIKFVIHFMLLAAGVITAIYLIIVIQAQLVAVSKFAESLGGKVDGMESWTKDGINEIKEGVKELNPF